MRINFTAIAEQKQINGLDFPLVVTPDSPETRGDPTAFNHWVHRHRETLHTLLIKHGAILFRDFPVMNAQDFEIMLDNTDFKNMPYIGGAAPRSQVTESRIVTANESPPSEKIPFHHEMAQIAEPPGYIFFYCEQAPTLYGATSLMHSHEAYKALIDIAPDFAANLERLGVQYIRTMPELTDKESAIGRSWRETFKVNTRKEAEIKMAAADMTWEWLNDGSVRTQTPTLPAIRRDPETGEKVFFNSIVAVYTGWNDARNKGEKSVIDGNGEPMNKSAIYALTKKMDAECVNFSWQSGDVLWVNNYTVLHARQPFTGHRRILASIAYK